MNEKGKEEQVGHSPLTLHYIHDTYEYEWGSQQTCSLIPGSSEIHRPRPQVPYKQGLKEVGPPWNFHFVR